MALHEKIMLWVASALFVLTVLLAGCGKVGVDGTMSQLAGNWAEVRLPAGCKAKQIASSSDNGVAVLCEDGRLFH